MEMESPSPYLQCSAVQCYSTPSSIRIPSLRSVLLRLPVIVERRMQGANKRLVSRLEHKGARHQNHKRRRKESTQHACRRGHSRGARNLSNCNRPLGRFETSCCHQAIRDIAQTRCGL